MMAASDVEQGQGQGSESGLKVEPERGNFKNARGLRLERYTWRASALRDRGFGIVNERGGGGGFSGEVHDQEPAGSEDEILPAAIVIFVHGYCVHARYEALLPEYPGAPGHNRYEGSITHRLNEVGFDVHAFDLQGHGLSEKYRGEPCYVDDFDDFAKDVIQFTEMVKREYADKCSKREVVPPLYIVGASMGGLVTLRTTQLAPDLANGIVLLAPAIMMLDEENYCCWYFLKKPALHFLNPVIKRFRLISRYRATDKDMWTTEGTDPLNYWGLMHFGMACNMMEGQLRTRSGPQIDVPYIILSSPNDTHVNSMGSQAMFEQTTSKDKTLCWMNNMGHSLLYEPPGCEDVVKLAVSWILERVNPGKSNGVMPLFEEATGEGKSYTIKRCVE